MAQMDRFPPQHVVTTAPGFGGPPAAGGVPRGLEQLTSVNELHIKQKVDWPEILCACCVIENEYTVTNSNGEKILVAMEGSNCCVRTCLRAIRPHQMRITDNYAGQIIQIERPCRCQSCWYPCCLQEITVTSPTAGGAVLGYVQQEWSIFKPKYTIKDANQQHVLHINGPCCPISCFFCDVHFEITGNDGQHVGEIRKLWSGFLKEWCTNADNYTITFDVDIDPALKATVLGAALLSDYMYFER